MDLKNEADTFWRRITLDSDGGQSRGEVVDNVHHFVVSLDHDGTTVTAARGEAIRVPWTTCPGAINELAALVGSSVAQGARVEIDQGRQCTHMLDTAKLAIAQIARGGKRTYQMLVRNGETPDICLAAIRRDGDELFEWHVRRDVVIAPAAFAGHQVRGRASWSGTIEADRDLREAALALRRSLFIFRSRPRSRDLYRARDLVTLRDVCFSFQSSRVDQAVRPPGFVELDF